MENHESESRKKSMWKKYQDKHAKKLADNEIQEGLTIWINEFTEAQHVKRKTKDACRGYCKWRK